MSIVLYEAPMSSATPVVHALVELGVPYEAHTLDLAAGDQRKPEFLALNPQGKVPTLVVDGVPLFEALAILQWLGDTHGVERGLWPSRTTPERLQALSWTAWAYVTCGATLQRLDHARNERVPAEFHNEALAKHTYDELQQLLGLLDARLASRTYLVGDTFSLVDLTVASMVTYGTFCGVSVEDHPNLKRWLQNFQARPSYPKVWGAP